MDGLRARRQKSGSPVGRIVDEAFDMIMQAFYIVWVGYALQMDNRVLETAMLGPNIAFFAMEMRFIMFGELTLASGEIGPVEVEIFISSVIASAGYLSPEFY